MGARALRGCERAEIAAARGAAGVPEVCAADPRQRRAITTLAGMTLQQELPQTLSAPAYAADVHPDGTVAIAGRTSTATTTWIDLWTPTLGVVDTKAFFAGAGVTGVMWTDEAVYQGARALITAHGFNGADSRTWILDTDEVISNGWSPGFGNAGRAAFRPAGGFGIVVGASSSVFYAFSGLWASNSLPGVGSASTLQGVAWHPSGDRALLVGRATGSPLRATAFQLLQGASNLLDPADLIDASIDGFDQPPYNGTSSAYLRDADWRPASTCDEGLIVGADGSKGWLIRFWDLDDDDC